MRRREKSETPGQKVYKKFYGSYSEIKRRNTPAYNMQKRYMTHHSLKFREKRYDYMPTGFQWKYRNPLLKYDENFIITTNKTRFCKYKQTNQNKKQSNRYFDKKARSKTMPSESFQTEEKWSTTLSKYINAKESMLKYLKSKKNTTSEFDYNELDKVNRIRQTKRFSQELPLFYFQKKQLKPRIKNQFVSNLYTIQSPSNRKNIGQKSRPNSFSEDLKISKGSPKIAQLKFQKKKSHRIESDRLDTKNKVESREDAIFINFVSSYFKRKKQLNKKNFKKIIGENQIQLNISSAYDDSHYY